MSTQHDDQKRRTDPRAFLPIVISVISLLIDRPCVPRLAGMTSGVLLTIAWILYSSGKGQSSEDRNGRDQGSTHSSNPSASPLLTSSSAKLRRLLTELLTDEQLNQLTFDHFRSVHETLTSEMPRNTKIHLSLIHISEPTRPY